MDYDVIITGAGPAGLSLALALANTPLRVLLIERSPRAVLQQPPEDGREIALTHASIQSLQALGAWRHIPRDAIAPIRHARVLDGRSPYSLDFDNEKKTLDALGYLVPNHWIRQALFQAAEACTNIDWCCEQAVTGVASNEKRATVTLASGETLDTSLAVAADSRFSSTRRMMGIPASMRDFSRTAIVCRMDHERPHHQTATEMFHYGHTLALLPMNGDRSSVVVTLPGEKAQRLLSLEPAAFESTVTQWLDGRLGKMTLAGERHAYPLVAVHASRFHARRFALVGDAAVGMHPVTAHGFNLGIRGAVTLAEEIDRAWRHRMDIGATTVLRAYDRRHQRITRPLYWGTNGIVGLYTRETLPARKLRGAVLRVANNLPPLKRFITSRLTEGAPVHCQNSG